MPDMLFRQKSKTIFSTTSPGEFLSIIQLAHSVHKFYKSLILEQLNSLIHLNLINFLIANAVSLPTHLAIVFYNRRISRIITPFRLMLSRMFLLCRFNSIFLHLWRLCLRMLVLNMSIQGSIRTVGLATTRRTNELFVDFFRSSSVNFLHHLL